MQLHENIKARRIELGMTQEELAKKMGYSSRSAINRIESGQRDISQAKIEAFAAALKTDGATLMGYTNHSEPIIDKYSYELHNSPKLKRLYEIIRTLDDSKLDALITLLEVRE